MMSYEEVKTDRDFYSSYWGGGKGGGGACPYDWY